MDFALAVLAQAFTGKRLGYAGTMDGSLKASGRFEGKGYVRIHGRGPFEYCSGAWRRACQWTLGCRLLWRKGYGNTQQILHCDAELPGRFIRRSE